MTIQDRYASAVNSRNLRPIGIKGVHEGSTTSDTDMLGAMGLASRGHPLGAALERLFAGDHKSAHEIVRILAQMAFKQSWDYEIRASRAQCHDLACAVLAWHRNGTCRVCNGHGYELIPGAPMLSERECKACRGTGKVALEAAFKVELRPLVSWLSSEMMRESGRVGPAAMRGLGRAMEL